jgi:hypothetical protein
LLFGAGEEALRLRHGFVGEEHFLLAMVRPSEKTTAAHVLRESGMDYEVLSAVVVEDFVRSDPPVEEADLDSGIYLNPAAHELMGRAEGLAAALGAGEVNAEHVLLALLWNSGSDWMFEGCGTTRQAVYERLSARGVPVPVVDLPPSPEPPSGPHQQVFFPRERLNDVLATLPSLLPPDADWGWNHDGGSQGWVSAFGDFDLEALVEQALSKRSG